MSIRENGGKDKTEAYSTGKGTGRSTVMPRKLLVESLWKVIAVSWSGASSGRFP